MTQVTSFFKMCLLFAFTVWLIQSPHSGWWLLPAWFFILD